MINRRQFLATTAAAAAEVQGAARPVALILDPSAQKPPCQWAASELRAALQASGIEVRERRSLAETAAGEQPVFATLAPAGSIRPPAAAEALALAETSIQGKQTIVAAGHDARGLTYALLELADRARAGSLSVPSPVTERPANPIRAISRLFCSDVEDLGWYHDRAMWREYLTMLAAQRFNRFHLAFGIGYDFLRQVSDAYFLFPYPFFLAVDGYNVRVPQITDAERDRNLETLRYITEQTVARGIDFQLGLWMHGYEWIDSPNPKHTIEGLTAKTHGPYCRDAVRALLKTLPAVSGVTFRVHGESGVEEGSYEFWKMVFEGVATCGRKVEIDMHAKGMDETMQNLAVATGLPVKISPKFWAEHMGMAYHQADIRDQERPKPGKATTALMKFSAGSRSFLRYGYGDLLKEDRRWGVIHRIWPGTQRLLLWGDPATAAAYSRIFTFCGSDGVDIMEPLSFKGRRGSGIAGGRCAYLNPTLEPKWDWQKYEYSYRVWGRALYNPDAAPESARRYLRKHWAEAAPDAEIALANSSRILPVITTAHCPSAANNVYWPELYYNQPMVEGASPNPYADTAAPKVFGNASALDPQLFASIHEFTAELVKGNHEARYTPIEVAQWLEDYAAAAQKHLAKLKPATTPDTMRLQIDVALESDIGLFFASKFRAGVLYRIHELTGDRKALEEAIRLYRTARDHWAAAANRAKPVYKADITIGERPSLRGHWADRIPAIDADISQLTAKLEGARKTDEAKVQAAIVQALGRPARPALALTHRPPARFTPGQALPIEVSVDRKSATVKLHYRHVTQAERFQSAAMQESGSRFRAEIPGSYASPAWPLEYYFEVRDGAGNAWLYPGLGDALTTQPYFIVRKG